MKRSTLLAAIFTMSWALGGGCGLDDSSQIKARNLQTGEIDTFSKDETIPSGYMVCPDEECAVSSSVPCESLGAELCDLNPACRIKILWCSGGSDLAPGASGGSADGATPGSGASDPANSEPPSESPIASTESCEVVCLPEGPLLCEELSDVQACQARSDCDWGQAICPICTVSSAAPSPDCECPSTCQTKQQAICQDLNQQECDTRPDCQWELFDCPPCVEGTPCTCPVNGGCRPSQSPVCPPPVETAYPTCMGAAEVYPVYDPMGCLIRYQCASSPNCAPVEIPAIGCENGEAPIPSYDPNGCIVDWQCPNSPGSSCKRTGCSGQVCANQDVPTDCMWVESYQCYDLAICDMTPDGTCGWINTPDFEGCMKQFN